MTKNQIHMYKKLEALRHEAREKRGASLWRLLCHDRVGKIYMIHKNILQMIESKILHKGDSLFNMERCYGLMHDMGI